jgi:hypothetical protein
MSPDQNENQPNSIIATALNFLEAVAPRVTSDPEKALRDLMPRMRYLVVARVEKPTVAQLEVLRGFREFEGANLIQIRKAILANDVTLGPFPGDLVKETLVPMLMSAGLSVSLRVMTPEEQALFVNNA